MSKVNQLNLKVLVPMYDEEDYEALCERADGLGLGSLTEDEQYFVDSYHRLDSFMSQLSQADLNELCSAAGADNSNEIYDKYMRSEMKFYKSTHKVSGEERMQQADAFLEGLEQNGPVMQGLGV